MMEIHPHKAADVCAGMETTSEQTRANAVAASRATDWPQDRPVVIYDGDCQLCQLSVAALKWLDVFGLLAYQNAREVFTLPKTTPPLGADKLLEQMYVITPGTDRRRAYGGFYAFRWLAWRLPVCWPIVPLLYLPGAAWVGERVYAWIARNRFRLVPCHQGVCQLTDRLGQSSS